MAVFKHSLSLLPSSKFPGYMERKGRVLLGRHVDFSHRDDGAGSGGLVACFALASLLPFTLSLLAFACVGFPQKLGERGGRRRAFSPVATHTSPTSSYLSLLWATHLTLHAVVLLLSRKKKGVLVAVLLLLSSQPHYVIYGILPEREEKVVKAR